MPILLILILSLPVKASSWVEGEDTTAYSPCPKVFHYETTLQKELLLAHLTVPFPSRGSVIHTTLIMTVQGNYEGYKGELVLTRNKSEVISDILNSKISVLEFHVHLPTVEPWPILGVILVNQVTICMGPMIVPENQVVTSLTLNYFLHLTRNSVAQSKTSNTTASSAQPLPATRVPVQQKLKDLINTSEIDLIRSYLNQTSREVDQTNRDWDESMKDEQKDKESLPKLDLRIDTSDPNRSFNSTDRKCSAFQRGYYPWIVAVYIKFSLGVQYHCTANLITSQHVILAGHCIQESKGSFIRAHQLILFFGKTKLSSWEYHIQTREVAQVFVHPQFDHFSLSSDVAILKFATPIEFSSRVAPICLWTPVDTPARVGMVVGWGLNPKTHNSVPNVLRPAIVQLIPWESCVQDRDMFYITSAGTLCAISVDGTGPCNGDSGAGLVMLDPKSNMWYLRALVSLAMVDNNTQRCDLSRSVVLTNISKFLAWIQETLKD